MTLMATETRTMTEKEAVRWQVTITCRRPPRTPGYENDTFHFRTHEMQKFFLAMQPVDDFELTFTARQVRLRFTYLASTKAPSPQWYIEGRLRNALARANNEAEHAVTVLATVLGTAYFQIEDYHGPDARLPGPVRVQLVELTKPT
jgi:hypothetical protein